MRLPSLLFLSELEASTSEVRDGTACGDGCGLSPDESAQLSSLEALLGCMVSDVLFPDDLHPSFFVQARHLVISEELA